MDIQNIKFFNECKYAVQDFFCNRGYLEVHTPSLCKSLIPESSIEVFETQNKLFNETFYLVPSPEVYIKKLIAEHKASMFELSHCFRAGESKGHIHSHEFTMLEYYSVGKDYIDSISITKDLFSHIVERVRHTELFDKDCEKAFTTGFVCLTMDEAFEKYAHFKLSSHLNKESLLPVVRALNIAPEETLLNSTVAELYELVLVSVIEPNLPKNQIVALLDYPVFSNTLSKRHLVGPMQATERWECYYNGVELANCYTELTDEGDAEAFLQTEIQKRKQKGLKLAPIPPNFAKTCGNLPKCSGVALGFDRLLMLLSGKKTIHPFIATL